LSTWKALFEKAAESRASVRVALFAVVVVGALLTPTTAGAHSRGRAVALDYRVSLIRLGEIVPGLRAEVIDGNRELRLTVDPRLRVLVRGLLGEPMLRFSSSGVWVNRLSPSAAADKLVPLAGAGELWTQLTRGHVYRWHDHRLTPPPGLRPGARRAWSLPMTVDGRRAAIRGWYERVRRPRWWAWLAGMIVVCGTLLVGARRVPDRRVQVAAVLATLAAVAAIVSGVAFAAADVIDPRSAWIQVGATVALAVAGVAACVVRSPSIERWTAGFVGVGVFVVGLSGLGVFWHGVVIASLPAGDVRLATAVAVVGGAAAATLATVAVEEERGQVAGVSYSRTR
jgi:hypothetical protein